MRLVFMGTPDIAKVCLQKICEAGHDVVGVYTKPDTPKNRGMKMTMSPVKEYAISREIPVFQPLSFRDPETVTQFQDLKPDLCVVVAYGKLLPQVILDTPPMGCVNMHASILPELRGAGPVQWSILNHMPETGITAMYMSAGMDEGDIIIVDRSLSPYNGCKAVCYLDGEYTVKQVEIQDKQVRLLPANQNNATYQPIEVTPDNQFAIWGVVTYVIKKM